MLMLPSARPSSRRAPRKWRVHRGAVVPGIAPLGSQPAARAACRARWRRPRSAGARPARRRRDRWRRTTGCRLRSPRSTSRDAAILDRFGSRAGGTAEKDLVELRAAHLVGKRHRRVERLGELERRALVVPRRHELGAPLRHADRLDLRAHAQAVEQRHVRGQQRFADVEAGMRSLLDHHDVQPALREKGRRRRSGGAAADHQHVAVRRGRARPGERILGHLN